MLPPRRSARRPGAAALALVAALAALLVAVAPAGSAAPADGSGRAAGGSSLVTGIIRFPQHDRPHVQMSWFTKDWTFLGKKRAGAGSYAVNLAPGTYRLQFADLRPSYVIAKYAPTDVLVTVGSGGPTIRNVTMRHGGYLTGTARTGDGRPAAKARVVAANRAENSFETTANKRGQFAIGGLPAGKYSVFTWDRRKRWVAKSTWAGAVKPRQGKDVSVRLGKRAGSLRVLLYTSAGALTGRTPVTVTSAASGQWWTATARGGTVVFEGLYPGRYRLKFDGLGPWLAQTGPVRAATVRSGRTVIGKFQATRRGGWVTGKAVDAGAPAYAIPGAQVQLYDAAGTKLDETTSSSTGWFTLDGRLDTQDGLSVVINPGPASGGWVQTTGYCHFGSTTVPGVPVTQGKETSLGAVGVRRDSPPDAGPACA